MIKLLVPLACLLLSGCLWQSVNNTDIEKAIHACGGMENIDHVVAHFTGSEKVKCKDGVELFLYEIKLPRKGEKQ